jgi:hypothetical protein
LLFDITKDYVRELYHVVLAGYLLIEQKFLMTGARMSFDSAILTKQESPSYVSAPISCDAYSNHSEYMKEFMLDIPVDA